MDVDEFVVCANRLIRNSEEPDDAAVARVLAGAELLPGWYEEWTLIDRERLRQLRLGALEVLANRRLAQARHHEALQAALAATATEPLHESAHRAVARIYIDDGNLVEAVSHFEMFEGMLRRELDSRPSGKFVEMMQPYLHHTGAGPR
ncbi:transcriptional activator [Kribbella sp. VKM Ac-2500]|uniref:AfsR/SARP family transcriptional regulator n=1 Tax=Kribbella TaxID=182639 RepID=UPI0010E6B03D|nr:MULTISPECIES: bacterial transcriptional activator domain-containing protein [Kribbella]TCN43309.1 transcriptional activator [Kribbella sp. VKM Ac-2500]